MKSIDTPTQQIDRDPRRAALDLWAQAALLNAGAPLPQGYQLESASDDASFRRYFRATNAAGDTYIFVDAPPDKEDSQAFVDIQGLLFAAGLRVPVLYQADPSLGFMMLSDFGRQLYLDLLQTAAPSVVEHHYQSAFSSLRLMQQVAPLDTLPVFDGQRLATEMNLFPEWFLMNYLQLNLDSDDQALLESLNTSLISAALQQPVVFVHRDYHCRNLMVIDDGPPGIIDFQDAVAGPVTYDLASLLKDCYHRFPRPQVVSWVQDFYEQLQREGVDVGTDAAGFLRWFDLMGMQRHLKCAGIFARLALRDGKARYLEDIPLVMAYILEVCALYPEFAEVGAWLERQVMPALHATRVTL
jgi:aminoglycoside/choline kinase family phosphotransferase